MKKIKEKMLVEMTAEDVVAINDLIGKATEMEGLHSVTENYTVNRCPICDGAFAKGDSYCANCGQKVRFVDYSTEDVIPL